MDGPGWQSGLLHLQQHLCRASAALRCACFVAWLLVTMVIALLRMRCASAHAHSSNSSSAFLIATVSWKIYYLIYLLILPSYSEKPSVGIFLGADQHRNMLTFFGRKSFRTSCVERTSEIHFAYIPDHSGKRYLKTNFKTLFFFLCFILFLGYIESAFASGPKCARQSWWVGDSRTGMEEHAACCLLVLIENS